MGKVNKKAKTNGQRTAVDVGAAVAVSALPKTPPSTPAPAVAVDAWPAYLSKPVLRVVTERLKFTTMTPVQRVVIPIFVKQHKDVVVEAITGSGKTLAFVVPVLELLLKRASPLRKHEIGALIISPTRELAQQIHSVVLAFLAADGLEQFKCILLVGGNEVADDLKQLAVHGAQIVIATAGRLEALLTRSTTGLVNIKNSFKSLEVLILDEADKLLELGFKESLETILKYLPKQRRTGLFSATQTDEIDKLIRAGLRNPCSIQVKQKSPSAQKTPVALNNYYMIVEADEKLCALVNFFASTNPTKSIIFMSSCASVQYFSKVLKAFVKDTHILALHRKVKEKRSKIFAEFRELEKGILVCTDIMSRGIDIEDVDWVIQYDPPKLASSFVHRCGRTARSGREGNAITFLLPNEDAYVNFILINQQVPLVEYRVDDTTGAVATNTTATARLGKEQVIAKLQSLASKERELYEKAKQAFVSYIRAYTQNECTHIFQVREVDLLKLAKGGFGLLHMPKMPEISKELRAVSLSTVDTSQIPYKDKKKEKERLAALQAALANPELSANGGAAKRRHKDLVNESWSKKREHKLKRKIKREKTIIRDKKRQNDDIDDDDYNELQKDFKLLSKLKRKKISEAKFDDEFITEINQEREEQTSNQTNDDK